MECHFQQLINQAVNITVIVQIMTNTGEYESTCAYYYLFLFSGWWFNNCGDVALNGKYNPLWTNLGFQWYSQATGYIQPINSEMKIRRQ